MNVCMEKDGKVTESMWVTIPRTIDRLKLINHYATLADKCSSCDLDTELPHIANWALEGVDAIKSLLAVIEEQRNMIDRLEHELGAARVQAAARQEE